MLDILLQVTEACNVTLLGLSASHRLSEIPTTRVAVWVNKISSAGNNDLHLEIAAIYVQSMVGMKAGYQLAMHAVPDMVAMWHIYL